MAPARSRVPARHPFTPELIEPAAGIKQEFAIAGRTLDRAFGNADDAPAGLRRDPGRDALADRAVNRRVAHDAALSDLSRSGFELRLDQRDETAPPRRQ